MIGIIDCGTRLMKEIKGNLQGKDCKVIKLEELEGYNFDSFSAIIISGSRTLLSEVNKEEYLKPFKFIKEINIPVLGICLGHQIIGLLHGAEISHGELILREEQIRILKENPLFLNLENHSSFTEEHTEFISLPENFELLAKSDSCENEAMKHPTKSIYSIQFHPEISGDNGKNIFENFLNICRLI
jgi:GMP synthase (glutamine-hydrolysing)